MDRAFALALAIKGIDGALELIGGLVLFVVPPSAITLVVRSLTQHELSEDPHDVIAIHVRAAAEQLAGSASVRGFGVLYLIGHGVIKLVLVGALVRRLRPAYPAAIVFLGSSSGDRDSDQLPETEGHSRSREPEKELPSARPPDWPPGE